jgi:hypothetical protein
MRGIAAAAGGAFAQIVRDPGELDGALRNAFKVVLRGRPLRRAGRVAGAFVGRGLRLLDSYSPATAPRAIAVSLKAEPAFTNS